MYFILAILLYISVHKLITKKGNTPFKNLADVKKTIKKQIPLFLENFSL